MKQIRLKDDTFIVKNCDCECPGYRYLRCFWGYDYNESDFPEGCPLEDYIEEKTKNYLDDIENLTGGPTIKITPKQYNEVKE